jgi:hypothetical protein
MRCAIAQRPGGKPLWRVSFRPRKFPLSANPAETRKKQAAPGNDPAVRSSTAGPKQVGDTGKSSRSVIPGSRQLPADRPANRQSGSPPGARFCHVFRGTRSIEDDDEEEDYYEERLALYFSFEIPDHAPDVSNPGTRFENLQTLLIRTHLQEFNSDSASAPANHFPTRRHIEIDSVCAH